LPRRHTPPWPLVGIDGLGESGGGAHPVAKFPLAVTWLVTIEARHSRHDDLVAIRLVHAVANPTAKRHAQGPQKGERAVEGLFPLSTFRSAVSGHPSFWLATGWLMGGERVRGREGLHGPGVSGAQPD
jgi:hypothetical protein